MITFLAFLVASCFYLASASDFLLADNNNSLKAAAFQGPPVPPPQETVMRAWTCHGRNQRELVDRLCQANIVQTPAVRDVMYQVDRINYSPPNSNPYDDAPQVLGWGQTISAPHMHAHALEEMYPYLVAQRAKLPPDQPLKVLDVGCGSGYLTASLGRLFQTHPSSATTDAPLAPGYVVGIDIHPQLVQITMENIKRNDADLLEKGVIKLQYANGWEGVPAQAPFDAIHVGASAADFPRKLAQQLRPGGVLVVPIGPQSGAQYLYRVERLEDSSRSTPATSDASGQNMPAAAFNPKDYRVTKLLGVRYVPLIEEPAN